MKKHEFVYLFSSSSSSSYFSSYSTYKINYQKYKNQTCSNCFELTNNILIVVDIFWAFNSFILASLI